MSLSEQEIETFIARLHTIEVKHAFMQQRYDALSAIHKTVVEQKQALQNELYARISKLHAVCKTIDTEDMRVITRELENMRHIIEYPHLINEK